MSSWVSVTHQLKRMLSLSLNTDKKYYCPNCVVHAQFKLLCKFISYSIFALILRYQCSHLIYINTCLQPKHYYHYVSLHICYQLINTMYTYCPSTFLELKPSLHTRDLTWWSNSLWRFAPICHKMLSTTASINFALLSSVSSSVTGISTTPSTLFALSVVDWKYAINQSNHLYRYVKYLNIQFQLILS